MTTASYWSIRITWPDYWPLIGQYWSCDNINELGVSYFLESMELFRKKFKRVVFVFVSDDLEWGRQKLERRIKSKDFFIAGSLQEPTLKGRNSKLGTYFERHTEHKLLYRIFQISHSFQLPWISHCCLSVITQFCLMVHTASGRDSWLGGVRASEWFLRSSTNTELRHRQATTLMARLWRVNYQDSIGEWNSFDDLLKIKCERRKQCRYLYL